MTTVNGLLMEELGKIPAVGDSIQIDGLHVTVTRSNGRRAELVEIALEEE